MPMTLALRTRTWAPPFVLMGVIFFLSAQPNLNSGLGVIDTILRKLVHAGEYGLLTFLWVRALRTTSLRESALPLAFALAVGYAATDEYHQTFVDGRHGTPVDVGIDAVGAAVALLGIRRHR
jgi:VanZ family protein